MTIHPHTMTILLSSIEHHSMAISASEREIFGHLGACIAELRKQQKERIQHLPRTQQCFIMQVIDTVPAQQDHQGG